MNTTDASGKVEEKDESVSVVARVPTAGLSGVNKVGENYDWVKGHVFNLGAGEYKNTPEPNQGQLSEENDAINTNYDDAYKKGQTSVTQEHDSDNSFIQRTQEEIDNIDLSIINYADDESLSLKPDSQINNTQEIQKENENILINKISQEAANDRTESKHYLDHIPVQSKYEKIFVALVEGLVLTEAIAVTTKLAPGLARVGLFKIGHEVAESLVESNKSLHETPLGTYRPQRKLPVDENGNKIPDCDRPHTQLGEKTSDKGYSYTQAREWGYDAKGNLVPKRDIDFTNHQRPNKHPNPHQHRYISNPTGGTLKRNKAAEPLINNVENTERTYLKRPL